MKILISPAKSLNFNPITYKLPSSDIKFRKEAWTIVKELRNKSPKDLAELMNISPKLAELNWKRNKEYKKTFAEEHSKQAIFAFDGEVYSGINANTLELGQLEFLQNNLRILSGQYGVLKPLDLIMPYRLEMGTKLNIGENKNLYEFWSDKLAKHILKESYNDEFIINLASNEYFNVVKKHLPKERIITPVFKDYKDGKLKTISFFAKKARGLMTRYLSNYKNEDVIEFLKSFNSEGYMFDSKLSDEKNFIFTR